MLKHLPVPSIQHVKQGSPGMHRRIIIQENDAVLQQLSRLLSDGRSQLLTDDPLVVRSVEKNSMDIEERSFPGGEMKLKTQFEFVASPFIERSRP